ncbi:MAG: hypothetical protein GEV07_06490 [Streptosporangiales bacterium]|nr:hypothetical protein [Streptosporangiales bacterium]
MNVGLTTAVLVGYFALMVGLSVWYGRRVKTDDDFVVAGRQLPRLVLTGTLLATWTGAGTIVARANFSYTYGPLASILYSIGAPLGIAVMYFFLASRIRALGKRTVPEIIELRYGRKVRLLSAGGDHHRVHRYRVGAGAGTRLPAQHGNRGADDVRRDHRPRARHRHRGARWDPLVGVHGRDQCTSHHRRAVRWHHRHLDRGRRLRRALREPAGAADDVDRWVDGDAAARLRAADADAVPRRPEHVPAVRLRT